MNHPRHWRQSGALYASVAYTLWGILPIYWKAFKQLSPAIVLAQRITWSLLFVALIFILRRKLFAFAKRCAHGRVFMMYSISATLIGANWLIYIWAVNTGHVVDASLGYFITPLVNAALGVLLLRERMSPLQVVSLALASAGVLILALQHGEIPWIALGLAATFGCYGLLKKRAALSALEGFSLESALLFLPALTWLCFNTSQGTPIWRSDHWGWIVLLATSGALTALPLISFAKAAATLDLVTLSFFQYLSPSLQFLLGVALYGEPFPPEKALAFGLIWVGILVFAANGLRRARRARPL